MPTFDEIIKRAAACGFPIAENEFTVTKQNPAPTLPFVCYTWTQRFTGSDGGEVRLKVTEGTVELYTDRKPDEKDLKLIAEFEKKVFSGVDYTRNQYFIRSENMTQTAYDFKIIEKLRKG
ncbi:MAG: hypothetical protein NC548_26500 [Lachnospiraceae bacterium]|nr:hypothetical protein [Lachnospiraceae bacterium]